MSSAEWAKSFEAIKRTIAHPLDTMSEIVKKEDQMQGYIPEHMSEIVKLEALERYRQMERELTQAIEEREAKREVCRSQIAVLSMEIE